MGSMHLCDLVDAYSISGVAVRWRSSTQPKGGAEGRRGLLFVGEVLGVGSSRSGLQTDLELCVISTHDGVSRPAPLPVRRPAQRLASLCLLSVSPVGFVDVVSCVRFVL